MKSSKIAGANKPQKPLINKIVTNTNSDTIKVQVQCDEIIKQMNILKSTAFQTFQSNLLSEFSYDSNIYKIDQMMIVARKQKK